MSVHLPKGSGEEAPRNEADSDREYMVPPPGMVYVIYLLQLQKSRPLRQRM